MTRVVQLHQTQQSGSSTWCSFPTTKPMSHPFFWHDDVPCHPKLSVHTRRSGLHSRNLIPFMIFCNIDLQVQLLFDSLRTFIHGHENNYLQAMSRTKAAVESGTFTSKFSDCLAHRFDNDFERTSDGDILDSI